MQLEIVHIETIIRTLEVQKTGMRLLLKMPYEDAVAIAAFSGSDPGNMENADPHEFRKQVLMQISDIDKAREAVREATGL